MQNFIKTVVEQIINKKKYLINSTIILPSKRASIFVKRELINQTKNINFLPEILSIEDFIYKITKINKADNIVLLFELYKVYINNTKKEIPDTFEQFSNWGSILIKDFNDIDSYLVDPDYIFSYLKDTNRINNWFKKNKPKTELAESYIHFFENIETYYKEYYKHLNNLKIGYQGLIYREASKLIDDYLNKNPESKYIFIGFNALNKSEINIIKKLLDENKAEIYFDLDKTILKENITASRFIKQYKEEWKYFNQNKFNSITNKFEKNKKISIIGVPKNVSQIKYANEIISSLSKKNEDIALVLANEELLTTTINSLPETIKNINITMGLPLKNIKYVDLINLIFKLHQNKAKIGNNNTFYYKDIISILNHNTIKNENCRKAIKSIQELNLVFINSDKIKLLLNNTNLKNISDIIFNDWLNTSEIINYCTEIINYLKTLDIDNFEEFYLTRLEHLFNQLNSLNNKYEYIESLDGFINFFNQLLQNETISFKGNAMSGLQIMGVLETRVIEYDTVIITSVNEGFLPSSKSNNSFIPFDIKHEIGLPTYQEKDSIFSYHFFRLIARSNNSYILYNTETDDFGSGEQSRFITQLEYLGENYDNLNITKYIVSPNINKEETEVKEIIKNDNIINKLNKINTKGLSPTALTNYIYNPIAFYKQKILGIYELDEIEETIANNTLGTVIHKVLEELYIPFKNKYLIVNDVIEMKKDSIKKIESIYKKEYKNGDITKGKNLLIFKVTKQFIINFLNKEIELLKEGKKIRIIDLEVDLTHNININDTTVKLIGQADRIDEIDGVIRIIDYKTGKVEQTSLNLVNKRTNNWDKLITDYKYSKAFQVLMYAYMFVKSKKIDLDNLKLESGIISFKNLKSGFMKINKNLISNNDLELFEDELKILLKDIFNVQNPFIENENLPF